MSEEPGWITKADAAALLGVDERTIERRARAGRINAKARPGHPTRYWAADVEKLRQTTPQEVRTGILETVTSASSNGNGAVAHQRHQASPIEALVLEVLQALRGTLAHGPTGPTNGATGPTDGPTAPTAPTTWIEIPEAARILGRSQAYVRRQIKAGVLHAERDRTVKVRRKDLEAL
jgi:predicted site-specific integrase-resolvase